MLNALLTMLNSGGWGESPKICDIFGFVAVPAALTFGLVRSLRARRGRAA